MSPAEALVERLRARGVELVAVGDRLRFRPADALTPEEHEALRTQKAEVIRLLTPSRLPPRAPAGSSSAYPLPVLDPVTVREALGDSPDPHAVACIAWDVMNAVHTLEHEIESGAIAPGLRLVHGRPLGDWLDLGDVARLLRAWRTRTATRW